LLQICKEMDDLLVILLSVVFILAGIFGQKNKKKNAANSNSVVKEPAKEDLWDFLDQKWEDSSLGEESHEVAVEEVPAPKQESRQQFHTEQESQRIFKKGSIENVSEKMKVRPLKMSKFPLKDAVIYSEILNRKYV